MYPSLLSQLHLDSRERRHRSRVLGEGDWKKVLIYVMNGGSRNGGLGMGIGTLGAIGMNNSAAAVSGGGQNALTRKGMKGIRLREPNVEHWEDWQNDDWRRWKEYRARIRMLLNPTSSTGGMNSSRSAREEMKSNMDASFHRRTVEHDPLQQAHTIRSGGQRKDTQRQRGRSKIAQGTVARPTHTHHQPPHVHDEWQQAARLAKTHRALTKYGQSWDRKLDGYLMTLERDSMGNRIQQPTTTTATEETTNDAVWNEAGEEDMNDNTASPPRSHRRKRLNSEDDVRSADSEEDNGLKASMKSEDEETVSSSAHPSRRSSGTFASTTNYPAFIRKLQSSNPHKHQPQSAAMAFQHQMMHTMQNNQQQLEWMTQHLQPSYPHAYHSSGSMSARLPSRPIPHQISTAVDSVGSVTARASTSLPSTSSLDMALASSFDAFHSAPFPFPPPWSRTTSMAGENNMGGPRPAGGSLFHRALLTLKGRKSFSVFDSEKDVNDIREWFECLAKEGSYSKITKQTFKNAIINAMERSVEESARGGRSGPSAAGFSDLSSFSPPSNSIHASSSSPLIDRARLDPFLDRLWSSLNSSTDRFHSRSSSLLDLTDFTSMIGLATQASMEDKAAYAFEVYDLDEDGSIDLHDLFVGLHMGLDTILPRDFAMIARCLHEKVEERERVEKERKDGSNVWSAALNDLPPVHITKSEFIRFHQAAHQQVMQARIEAGEAPPPTGHRRVGSRYQPTTALPPLQAATLPTLNHGHLRTTSSISTNSNASTAFASTSSSTTFPTTTAAAAAHAKLSPSPQPHVIELVDLLARAFILPLRKAGNRLGSSGSVVFVPNSSARTGTYGESSAVAGVRSKVGFSTVAHAMRLMQPHTRPGSRLGHRRVGSIGGALKNEAMSLPSAPEMSDEDALLLRLRSASNSRLNLASFRNLVLQYFTTNTSSGQSGSSLDQQSQQLDLAEVERVIDFLFYAFDTTRSGSIDGSYAADCLSLVLNGDRESHLQFYYRLLDLDRDGMLSARDLCNAYDASTSQSLRTDLVLLLDAFAVKLSTVISNTRRTVTKIEEANRLSRLEQTTTEIVDEKSPMMEQINHSSDSATGGPLSGRNAGNGSATPVVASGASDSSLSHPHPPLLDPHQQVALLRSHATVSFTIDEMRDVLSKSRYHQRRGASFCFINILRRQPTTSKSDNRDKSGMEHAGRAVSMMKGQRSGAHTRQGSVWSVESGGSEGTAPGITGEQSVSDFNQSSTDATEQVRTMSSSGDDQLQQTEVYDRPDGAQSSSSYVRPAPLHDLTQCGDVESNPGPEGCNPNQCQRPWCMKTINVESFACDKCGAVYCSRQHRQEDSVRHERQCTGRPKQQPTSSQPTSDDDGIDDTVASLSQLGLDDVNRTDTSSSSSSSAPASAWAMTPIKSLF